MNHGHLFGGALFAAGLAVSAVSEPAQAGDGPAFTFTDYMINYGVIFGNLQEGGVVNQFSYAYGRAYFGYDSYSGNGLDVTVFANPSAIGFTHNRDTDNLNWAYTKGVASAWFSVTEDATVRLDWDMGEWGEGSYIKIADFGGGGGEFFESEGAGSANVALTAGDMYRFTAFTRGNIPGGDSFGAMTIIPAPGSLPLLAAGGLLVSRRRRRE